MAAPTLPARLMARSGHVLNRVVLLLLYTFLLAPIVIVAVFSFNSGNTLAFPLDGFSVQGYVDLANNTRFIRGLQVSLITSTITTVLVLIAGVMGALAIDRHQFRGKGLVTGLFLAPFLVPGVVLGLGLLLTYQPLGLTGTYAGLVVAHFGVALPYVVRTTMISLSTADTSCEEAARVLGANSWSVFGRITLPIISKGVIAGAVIAFITSFDDAVLAIFVAGSRNTTLPVEMFRYVQSHTDAQVAALSVVLIAISLIVVVIVERALGLRKAL